MRPIGEVARGLGIPEESLEVFGQWKAKIALDLVPAEGSGLRRGKLVLITGMTPTPNGEGKTVTAIGLAMGLNRLGRKAVVSVRQPSLGPTFGIKGGAAGGGMCTVEPMQEINLGFTGDIDAVGAAHNLLAAMVDNPSDLVQPRAETAAYTARRTTILEKYRAGLPTGESSENQAAKISDVGK